MNVFDDRNIISMSSKNKFQINESQSVQSATGIQVPSVIANTRIIDPFHGYCTVQEIINGGIEAMQNIPGGKILLPLPKLYSSKPNMKKKRKKKKHKIALPEEQNWIFSATGHGKSGCNS